MERIVEVNEQGEIHLPADVLGNPEPHTQYKVQESGQNVVLSRIPSYGPRWQKMTPEERAADFRGWVASHADGPGLPDEAVSRENMYE